MKKLLIVLHSRLVLRFIAPLGIVLFGCAIAYGVYTTRAIAGPGEPFGGMISFVMYCTCSMDGSIAAVYFPDLASPSTTGGLPLIYGAMTTPYLNWTTA